MIVRTSRMLSGRLVNICTGQTITLSFILKLLRIDHQDLTCKIISENLDILDEWQREVCEEVLDFEDSIEQPPKSGRTFLRSLDTGNAYLGSANKAISLEELQEQHSNDAAFFRFRTKFTAFLQATIPMVNNRSWAAMPEHKVCYIHSLSANTQYYSDSRVQIHESEL